MQKGLETLEDLVLNNLAYLRKINDSWDMNLVVLLGFFFLALGKKGANF